MVKIALLFTSFLLTFGTGASAQSLEQVKKFRLEFIPNKMIYQWAQLTGDKAAKEFERSGTPRKEVFLYLNQIADHPLNVAVVHADLEKRQIDFQRYSHGVTEHTPLFLYSITKSFVGLSTLSAVCEHNINLDDNLGKHSPRLKNTVYAGVSIRQALKMQSGVMTNKYFLDNLQVSIFKSLLQKQQTPLETIEKLTSVEKPAGQSFEYSGYDTNALLILIEDLTKKSFLDRFRKDYFENNGLGKPIYWMTTKNAEPAGMAGLTSSPLNVVRLADRYLDILTNNKCVSQLFAQGKLHDQSDGKYGFQVWYTGWTSKDRKDIFHMRGNGGQIISINIPAKTVTFVYSLAQKYGGLGEISSALGKFERSVFP